MKISFNKPFITGSEEKYIHDAIESGSLSGNGKYTNLCHNFFREKFGFQHCLLTSSCTDALEMSSILIDIKEGDEVIIPTYTFVSAANAFALRGAKIVYADSEKDHPNIDVTKLESLISIKTKAIVVVHYAGVATDMDAVMAIAEKHDLIVIEDAAQALGTKYKNKYLGTIGHLATFSFHATKNIICGEGGLLVVNDEKYIERSEIIWEKGTNRTAFKRGEVDKYTWVDLGSSFLPSEITAAFLWGQLQHFDAIQSERLEKWNSYLNKLIDTEHFKCPTINIDSTNNAHIFYIVCKSKNERDRLSKTLYEKGIQAYFHFLCLHKSPKGSTYWSEGSFPNAMMHEECLLRLPLYNTITEDEIKYVVDHIESYFDHDSPMES